MAGKISAQNGKLGGRPRGRKNNKTIKAIATREAFIKKIEASLEPIFKSLLSEAKKGNVQALKELLDRAWGKPTQPLSGDKDNPLTIKLVQFLNDGDNATT